LSILLGIIEVQGRDLTLRKVLNESNPSPLSESQVVDLVSDVTWSQSSSAAAITWSAFIYTRIDVSVGDELTGSGSCWGFALGASGLTGTMFYDSEDTLLSAENDFYMVTVSFGFGGAGIVFVIDGNIVGFLALGGGGADWAFAYGKFRWLIDES